MADNQLIAKNDFIRRVFLEKAHATTRLPVPDTTGPYTGFISANFGSTATEAHATLSVDGNHTGVDNDGNAADGYWGFAIDAAILLASFLTPLLGAPGSTCYFIVEGPNNIRRYEPLTYEDAVQAEVISAG